MALDSFGIRMTAAVRETAPLLAKERFLSEHLPYFTSLTDDVLMLRDGSVLATLKLDGLYAETTDDKILQSAKRAVASVVSQCGPSFGFYVHRLQVPQTHFLKPVTGNPFAEEIDRRWQAHLSGLNFKKQQLFLSVVRKHDIGSNIPLFGWMAKKTFARDREARAAELNEVMGFFEAALTRAHPVRLTTGTGDWLGYFNALLTGRFAPMNFGAQLLPLSATMTTARTTFRGNGFTVECGVTGERRYGAVFSLKEYPSKTGVNIMNDLDLPFDSVLTNSFTPIPRNLMAPRIARIIRQMQATDDAAKSLSQQLIEAADDLESGRIGFGDHHLSIAVYTETEADLNRAASQVRAYGQDMGAAMVRETIATKAVYFGQHPGNFEYRARKIPISTLNFADLSALHGSLEGRAPEKSPWGENVTVFPTTGSTGYRLNFHEAGSRFEEPTLGHTLVMGNLGSGKSLTSLHLCAQALRTCERLFFFDKNLGLEMGIRALGGRYHRIKAGEPTGLNPLATETDERGRAWLSDWLAAMLSRQAPLSGHQTWAIQNAVNQNAEIDDPALRTLSQFEELFRYFDDEGDLLGRLSEWIEGGRYGWVFQSSNAPDLVIDDKIVGFDMTEILNMTTERTAVLSYIFRQIERLLEDAKPTIILIDEAWKVLDDEYFAKNLTDWLVTLRKLNCVVILLTQFPKQLQDSRVGKTVIDVVPTQLLFPNDRANPADYAYLGVNEKEAEMLTRHMVGQRVALQRSVNDSLFLDVDLSALGGLLTILGGGKAGEAAVGPNWRDRPDFWKDLA